MEMRPRSVLHYLAGVSVLKIELGLLEGEYVADPATFRKRLTPTLAECARNTPRRDGRIRWQDFVTWLSDDGVVDLFWVLNDWAHEKGLNGAIDPARFGEENENEQGNNEQGSNTRP